MNDRDNVCGFCDISNGREGLFRTNPHLQHDLTAPLMFEGYAAIPDAAPLGQLHVLVMPREHVLSMAQLDRLRCEKLYRFLSVITNAMRQRLDPNSSIYFFEHGSRFEDEMTGCSTTHAHFHMFIAKRGLLQGAEFGFERYDDLDSAWRAAGGSDYYLIGSWNDQVMLAKLVEEPKLRCNLFARKYFAGLMGKPEWADYTRYNTCPPDELSQEAVETYEFLASLGRGLQDKDALAVD